MAGNLNQKDHRTPSAILLRELDVEAFSQKLVGYQKRIKEVLELLDDKAESLRDIRSSVAAYLDLEPMDEYRLLVYQNIIGSLLLNNSHIIDYDLAKEAVKAVDPAAEEEWIKRAYALVEVDCEVFSKIKKTS
ncbi:MAG: hypothetical protein OEY44_03170 [Candidatus Peregrinibacteria bacterium]|nr:hypothetical protein [Candidatus Peregrinibacteria bacterium]